MGKIRVNTIGDEEAEKKQKEEAEKRRLAKIEAEKKAGAEAKGRARLQGEAEDKCGTDAEKETDEILKQVQDDQEPAPNSSVSENKEAENPSTSHSILKDMPSGSDSKSSGQGRSPKKSKYALKKGAKHQRGKKYLEVKALIDRSKEYSVKEALALVEKAHVAKFDETVELHINTLTTGVSGIMNLPHGTGKATKVAILAPSKDPQGADALLKEIESGKINFDVLIATPDAMPRLAKVARVLGPKGLMPNPKNGTVTPKPEELAKKYEGGQTAFKTEAKSPILHLVVGRLSFGPEKLAENIQVALQTVKITNVKNAVVKSTMSPSVKLSLSK